MSDSGGAPQCAKPDCQVEASGICLEGHDKNACPNHRGAHEVDESQGDAREAQRIELPSGMALTPSEIEAFARWREPTLIAIVGDSFSGKTTLVCALYDRFLRGPFAGLSFGGSRTLMALEERSHYSRVESGLTIPDTARTSIADGLRYFHLSAMASPLVNSVELLLSDRAGELYRQARANSDRVKNLPEIFEAHRVVILLDGGRLASPEERASALHGARQMLRVLIDNDALDGGSVVQLVTAKWDLVQASADHEAIVEALASFQARLTTDFAARLSSLSYWRVAARDPTGGCAPAFGLDGLLTDWTTPRLVPRGVPPPLANMTSEFDRLLARTPDVTP